MLRVYKNSRFKGIEEEALRRMAQSETRVTAVSERFRSFVEGIIPKMEREVEVRILNKLYHSLQSSALRSELLNAYHRRKLDVLYDVEGQNVYPKELVSSREEQEPEVDYSATNLAAINRLTVGKVFRFSLADFYRYFPYANFGQNVFVERHLMQSFDFSVFVDRPAFAIISHLRRLTAAGEKGFIGGRHFEEVFLGVENREDLEHYVYKDAEVFLGVVFDLAHDLRAAMIPLRYDPALYHFIECSFFFDTIVMCFAWEMHRYALRQELLTPAKRLAVFTRLLQRIRAHPECKHFVQQKPESFLTLFGRFRVAPRVEIDFAALASLRGQLPAPLQKHMLPGFTSLASNVLVWGRQGSGKSGLLYGVTLWAIKSDWLVIKLPSARAVTHARWRMRRDHASRLYVSEEFAQKTLMDVLQSNPRALERPVDPALYGFYSLAGVHAKEPEPVPNFYIPERQTFFYETDRLLMDEEVAAMKEEMAQMDKRLTDELPRPRSLADIVRFGIENELYATACLAELLEQAYASPDPVLVVIDDYNWLYRPTNFASFRYVDVKGLGGKVPPHHLSLARLFMKFDGHLIRNGFKLAATSNYSISRHHFTPAKISFPAEACFELKGAEQTHFRNFCAYCRDSGLDNTGHSSEDYAKMVWMENQGNFGAVMRIFEYPDFRFDESV